MNVNIGTYIRNVKAASLGKLQYDSDTLVEIINKAAHDSFI